MPEATNDQGFAMTSSFTSMTLAAWLVLGAVADPDDLVGCLATAAERIMANRQEDIRRLASSGYERVVYLGSGLLKGLAHESSLKLLDLTAGEIVTYFESPLGFRHGPSPSSTIGRWPSATSRGIRTRASTTWTSSPS